LDDFLPVQRLLADVGMVSGLAQTLLKLTCPGVPDIYQGAELWQLALVDPDNRRPVDYGLRRQMLGGLADAALPAELERWRDGAVKQELIRRVLALRARRPGLFAQGGYKPLAVRGALAGHAVAFARQDEGGAMVVVAPRLAGRLMERAGGALPLGELWRGTHVEVPRHRAGAGWRELLSGRELAVAGRRMELSELLSGFPMAVLEERTPG
jgi:(1->4)-alpha-D-glucan 1-alpha-D-glucosylmutase